MINSDKNIYIVNFLNEFDYLGDVRCILFDYPNLKAYYNHYFGFSEIVRQDWEIIRLKFNLTDKEAIKISNRAFNNGNIDINLLVLNPYGIIIKEWNVNGHIKQISHHFDNDINFEIELKPINVKKL